MPAASRSLRENKRDNHTSLHKEQKGYGIMYIKSRKRYNYKPPTFHNHTARY